MTTYYADAMNGRDSGPGSSPTRPWKTLRHSTRNLRSGDILRLRRARTWSEPLRLKGSGRRGCPITVGAWGEGPRPRIASAASPVVGNHGPVSWWTLKDLDVCGSVPWAPHGRAGGKHAGIAFRQDSPSDGLTVERCVVHDVDGPGIAFHAGDSPRTVFHGWTVDDCDVYHAATGITCGGPWPPGADPYRFHENFRVANCRTHDIGTDGIVLSHCRNGVIEYCDAYRTGIGITRRTPVGIWFFQAQRCVIQYCESYDNHTAGGHADGGGFDLDGGAVDCVMQYNYSHDNDGAGYLICSYDPKSAPCTGCVTRFNISVNDGRANDYPAILFWQAYDCLTYNNTCITRVSSPLKFISPTWGHVVANNLFVVDSRTDIPVFKSAFPVHRNRFLNNLYWRTGGKSRFAIAPWKPMEFSKYREYLGGTGEIVANPRLASLTGIDLGPQPGSRAVRNGIRLPGLGDRDFHGMPLPKTGPLTIGAIQ